MLSAEPSDPAEATTAELLASWWAEPTREDADRWSDPGWWIDVGTVWASTELAPGLPERLSALVGSGFEELSGEYQRLFVGPGAHPCPPYESVWRTDRPRLVKRTVLGASAGEVKALYAELGMRVREQSHELPDHVAVELEALAVALGPGGSRAVGRSLLDEHLAVWIPVFCESVTVETAHAFYGALAEGTAEWVVEMRTRVVAADDGG